MALNVFELYIPGRWLCNPSGCCSRKALLKTCAPKLPGCVTRNVGILYTRFAMCLPIHRVTWCCHDGVHESGNKAGGLSRIAAGNLSDWEGMGPRSACYSQLQRGHDRISGQKVTRTGCLFASTDAPGNICHKALLANNVRLTCQCLQCWVSLRSTWSVLLKNERSCRV